MSLRTSFFTRFTDVWCAGDLAIVDELFPADVAYHLPPFPDVDREGLKQFAAAFHQAFPDFTLAIDEELVDGDTTCHRWHCAGTYTGESALLPGSPTGTATAATGTHFVHWRDDRPVEVWHHGDWLGWLQGCGVLPPLG